MSDLERATQLASSMFALWGLSPDTSDLGKANKNLAVVIGDASVSESQHVESLVRDFLEKMMLQTIALLAANQTYLTKVVEALTEKHVLLQTDFYELLNESNETASSAHGD
jgi:ATP-dependent Zn protease